MPDIQFLHDLVHALGWMLVHFIWQGSLIAAALWVTFKLSSPESARLRYWSGLAAYLGCALAPVITLSYYLRPATVVAPVTEVALPAFSVATGYRVTGWQLAQQALEPAMPVIVGLWAVGVMLLSSRTFMGWLGTRRLVRQNTQPVSAELGELAEFLRLKLGVRRAVQVLSSTRVLVPSLIGWIKPVILLPAGVIARLPRDQIEMILAHELAHVRRHDYLVNLLQVIIETLFFYHPAVRWMSRHVGQEREHCCDDMVVARCGKPVVYARALASLEALREPVHPTALAAAGGDLFQRVSRIVRQELPRTGSGFAHIALVAGLALAASLSAHQGMEMARNMASTNPTSMVFDTGTRERMQGAAALGEGLRLHGREQQRQAMVEQARLERLEARERAAIASAERAQRLAALDSIAVQGQRVEIPVFGTPLDRPPVDLASTAPAIPENDEYRSVPDPVKEVVEPTVRAISAVAPSYPSRAERNGIEGWVKLRFQVNRAGKAAEIEVADAQPEELFDRAAIKALKQWEFEVTAAHDPGQALVQTFDFALAEPVAGDSPRSIRCTLTGSRLCPKNVSEEELQEQYNRKSR